MSETHYDARHVLENIPFGVKIVTTPFANSPWPFPATQYRGVVLGNYDGDTMTVFVEMADFVYIAKDVRLLGVDCYELEKGKAADRAKGAQAKAFTASKCPNGAFVMLREAHGEVTDTEKYGRMLARVFYMAADGVEHDLAAELIAAGFQKPAVAA